ncbi:uncharacterized protein AMSG_03443 [Thecamonas trahens ATCC 50062]|uniref:C2 NT-type domain-containing protein n=1 Tax=Thecamonas trahens ATCC 50062 TaxID=461836 RepID=A0A0L0D436_THETB|nr:hypothetical protein AMSG_03443 [Thecamonas trahens ATCC 50062]KNC47020.1 hypothetical protein AMSG_03443 [Thecamonas trahens ATCC 50062]|eukprot:XP_013759800.1 hypothetical protein AMSG_03443 [Thecamonas trahens ATCC 50062]
MFNRLRRRGKRAHKFVFLLTVHSAEVKRAALSEGWEAEARGFVARWTHGGHEARTSTAVLERGEVVWDEELSMTGRLYKRRDGDDYDDKQYKLRLIEDGKRSHTRAVLVLNFADFVAASPVRGGFRHRVFLMDADAKRVAHCSINISLSWQRISKETGSPLADNVLDETTTSLTPGDLSAMNSSEDETSDGSSAVPHDFPPHHLESDDGGIDGLRRSSSRHRHHHHRHYHRSRRSSSATVAAAAAESSELLDLAGLSPADRAAAIEARAARAARHRRADQSWVEGIVAAAMYALALPLTAASLAAWFVALRPAPRTLAGAPMRALAALSWCLIAFVWLRVLVLAIGTLATPSSVVWWVLSLLVGTLLVGRGAAAGADGPYDVLGLPNIRPREFAPELGSAILLDTLAVVGTVYVAATLTRAPALLALVTAPPTEPDSLHCAIEVLVLVGEATLNLTALPLWGMLLAAPWRLGSLKLNDGAGAAAAALLAGALDWILLVAAGLASAVSLSLPRWVRELRAAQDADGRQAVCVEYVQRAATRVYAALVTSNPVGRGVVGAVATCAQLVITGVNAVAGLIADAAGSSAAAAAGGLSGSGAVLASAALASLAWAGPAALVLMLSTAAWAASCAVAPLAAGASVAKDGATAGAATVADLIEPVVDTWLAVLRGGVGLARSIGVRGSVLVAQLALVVVVGVWLALPLIGASAILPGSSIVAAASVIATTALLRRAPAEIETAWHESSAMSGRA